MIPAVIEIGKRDGLLVFRIVDFCLYQIGKIIVTKLPAEPPDRGNGYKTFLCNDFKSKLFQLAVILYN